MSVETSPHVASDQVEVSWLVVVFTAVKVKMLNLMEHGIAVIKICEDRR